MKGPSIIFLCTVFFIIISLSILTFVIGRKVFPVYKTSRFTVIFWLVNLSLLSGAVVSWQNIIEGAAAALLIKLAVVCFMAEVIFLLCVAGYGMFNLFLAENTQSKMQYRRYRAQTINKNGGSKFADSGTGVRHLWNFFRQQ